MKNKQTLTLMVGLARCGKSTWVQKNKKDAVVVCPDEIRVKIFGHEFHKEAEDYIWAFAKSMTRLLLDQGKSVIIDATNINNYSRDVWIRLAREYKTKIRIVWIKTGIVECLKRNKKADRNVPEEVITGMALHFENLDYKGPSNDNKDIEVIEIPKRTKLENEDEFSDTSRYAHMGNYYHLDWKEWFQRSTKNGNN